MLKDNVGLPNALRLLSLYAAKESPLMNYIERPLWLVRGEDRVGNDFSTGHGPRVTTSA